MGGKKELVFNIDLQETQNDIDVNFESKSEHYIRSYTQLRDKPTINGVELDGNKSSAELGLVGDITGASAGQLIKILSVDDDGKPTAWVPAVAGVDYPDPNMYGPTGIIMRNGYDEQIHDNAIIMFANSSSFPEPNITDKFILGIIISAPCTVEPNANCDIIVGAVQSLTSTFDVYYNLCPDLRLVLDLERKKAFPYLKGVGNIIVGANGVSGSCNGAFGVVNVIKANHSLTSGQANYVEKNYGAAFGKFIELTTRSCATAIGLANESKVEDMFEVGNGAVSETEIARSNAFRVTYTGDAIAQNTLGIEDGEGNVISITAAELQALKELIS